MNFKVFLRKNSTNLNYFIEKIQIDATPTPTLKSFGFNMNRIYKKNH